jgi:hypothetical protein
MPRDTAFILAIGEKSGLARISHQCGDTWAKGFDEDLRKEDRLN